MLARAERLRGVKTPLVLLVIEVGFHTDILVTCGLRTREEQAEMVRRGASLTMNSKHLTGDAVDLAVMRNGAITWDFPAYEQLAVLVKKIAHDFRTPIVWGGDWKTLKDGPHFELVTNEGVST